MYFPESSGIKFFSFRYQSELLRYGSIRLVGILCPSFNQVYLRGGAPFALHFNLMLCDAGHALNDLFNVFGSEKVGAAKTEHIYQTKKHESIQEKLFRQRGIFARARTNSRVSLGPAHEIIFTSSLENKRFLIVGFLVSL